jgi:hypothetical protein
MAVCGKRYLDWTLGDPAGKSVEDVRPVRDEIERRRVRGLLDELGVRAAGMTTTGSRRSVAGTHLAVSPARQVQTSRSDERAAQG